MSRALRRQPLVQKPPAKSPSFRPSGGKPAKKQTAAPGAEAPKVKRSLLERIPLLGRPMQDIFSELKKVSWPSREETWRLSFAVMVVTIIIGAMLGSADIGLNWVVDNTLLR